MLIRVDAGTGLDVWPRVDREAVVIIVGSVGVWRTAVEKLLGRLLLWVNDVTVAVALAVGNSVNDPVVVKGAGSNVDHCLKLLVNAAVVGIVEDSVGEGMVNSFWLWAKGETVAPVEWHKVVESVVAEV